MPVLLFPSIVRLTNWLDSWFPLHILLRPMGYRDQHLNCFYSYNRDNELIENNLTRAFMVALRGLSGKVFNELLSSLNPVFKSYDMSRAEFALQSNIEAEPKEFKHKYVVTISTDRFYYLEDQLKQIKNDVVKSVLHTKTVPDSRSTVLSELCYGSIPDAWIYDCQHLEYCFLIECKKQSDRINFPQIIRHAYENFGIDDIDEIDKYMIRLTWYDILEEFERAIDRGMVGDSLESFLMKAFVQYLGYHGYHRFTGVRFIGLSDPPGFVTTLGSAPALRSPFLFSDLVYPPGICFQFEGSANLFAFRDLAEPTTFAFRFEQGSPALSQNELCRRSTRRK